MSATASAQVRLPRIVRNVLLLGVDTEVEIVSHKQELVLKTPEGEQTVTAPRDLVEYQCKKSCPPFWMPQDSARFCPTCGSTSNFKAQWVEPRMALIPVK